MNSASLRDYNNSSQTVADEIKKLCTFAKNTARGSVAQLALMFIYLFLRLASKDGRTDIGDTLVNKSSSRLVAYLHFFASYLLSHELYFYLINIFLYGKDS
jgi:hypothetical protein